MSLPALAAAGPDVRPGHTDAQACASVVGGRCRATRPAGCGCSASSGDNMNLATAFDMAIDALTNRLIGVERLVKLYEKYGESLESQRVEARHAAKRYAELTEAIALLKAERDKAVANGDSMRPDDEQTAF